MGLKPEPEKRGFYNPGGPNRCLCTRKTCLCKVIWLLEKFEKTARKVQFSITYDCAQRRERCVGFKNGKNSIRLGFQHHPRDIMFDPYNRNT